MSLARVIAEPVMHRPVTPDWLTQLAAFCAGLTFEALPQEVVRRTALVLLDSVGAIAAGANEPETQALIARLVAENGTTGAAVIGGHIRTAPSIAAFLNGTSGTMLELDEGNQYCRGHPGIHVVPAVLAAAHTLKSSGRDILTAVALGYEVGARIGIASKLRVTMHPHGTWGTVGAAVAVAFLHRANAKAFVEVINVASSLGLTTSRRTMLEGGTVRNSYAGFSNQLGLMAWDLVASGFIGEADGLSTVYGTVAAENFQPDEMVAELGTRWEIARNYFKRHACCRYNHGALDALHEIMARAGGSLDPARVARVDVETYIWAAQLASQEPHNMLAAKFSLPFAIATTIVTGQASLAAFGEAARADGVTRDLARRVFVREDAAMTAMLPALRPARVTVTLTSGETLSAERHTNRGDTEDPYTEAEVRDKYRDLAVPVFGVVKAQGLMDLIDALAGGGDASALLDALAG